MTLNPALDNVPVCSLVYDKDIINENGKQVSKLEIVIKDTVSTYTKYKNISLHMTWFNDTNRGYHKVFRIQKTYFNKYVISSFLDLRQSTAFSGTNDQSNYDWNSTITTNTMQGMFYAKFHLLLQNLITAGSP